MVMPTTPINSARSTASPDAPSSGGGVKSLAQRMAAKQASSAESNKETELTPGQIENNSEFLDRLLAANPQSAKEIRKLLTGMHSEGKNYLAYKDKLVIVGTTMKTLKEAGSEAPEGLLKLTNKAYVEVIGIDYFSRQIRDVAMNPDKDGTGESMYIKDNWG